VILPAWSVSKNDVFACLACGAVDRLRLASRSWLLNLAFCNEANYPLGRSFYFEDLRTSKAPFGPFSTAVDYPLVDRTTILKHRNRKKAFCVLKHLLIWHSNGMLALLPCRSFLFECMIGGMLSEKCCVLLREYPNKPTRKWIEKMCFNARCSFFHVQKKCRAAPFSLMLHTRLILLLAYLVRIPN
jgi:hypothetical protein